MKFVKVQFTVSLSICILFGLVSVAMSRDEVPGQRSVTYIDQSTINPTNQSEVGPMMILYGTRENAGTSVPPPPMQRLSRRDHFVVEQPQFIVTYTGFTDEARAAFQYAVDIWDALIRSPVPIRIDATFTDFRGYEDGRIILGGARPAGWKSPTSLDIWFVDALADKRAGRDLDTGEPDIITRFNSHEDVNWYFGTDGNTPSGKMDFVSAVLHEIAHGLGFSSFAKEEDFSTFSSGRFSPSVGRGELRSGNPELPQIYDFFVVNGSGAAITSFPDPSMNLLNQFTGNDLFWNGGKAVAANGGARPQLFAPSKWYQGSSYTHLDEATFPPGDVNSLMTPDFDRQEVIHDPGPITLGMFADIGWTINKAPMFVDGSTTTRTVAEDAGAGVSIGSPVVATDANNDALTYELSDVDATLFDIDSTSGQLRTKAALRGGTKTSYTVTVTVSDGSLVDKITVIITVIKIVVEVPANSGPEFIDGSHTTRTVAEHTARGINIGDPVAARDADNDSLTYTLSGVDAASFDIAPTTGQLKTHGALDYETKRTYTLTVTVSDGNLTDSINVTIDVNDLDDQGSPTITLTSQPLTEATLNGSVVTLTLSNRAYETWLNNPIAVSGITGVTVRPANVERVSNTALAVELTFDGTDFDTNATLTFRIKAEAIANYNGPALTATANVTAAAESVVASAATPLSEGTLNGSVVTLTLSGGVYEPRYTVGNNITVSGITGVIVNRFDVERISDTQVKVELIFDGTDFDTDATLTFKVKPDAVVGYNGADLITQLPVIAVVEQTPIVTALALLPLTETTLNESVVILTLSSGVYMQSSSDIRAAVQVSGIGGVRFRQSDVTRLSDTKVVVKLTFDGTDFDTDTSLTFTVGPGAIAAYNGPALVAELPVTAVIEERPTVTLLTPQRLTESTLDGSIIRLTLNNGTYVQSNADIENALTVSGIVGVSVKTSGVDRVNDTEITVELAFDGNLDTGATLTLTVGANAISAYNGPALIAQALVSGGRESIVATTESPLTETTLDGSVVTLTLNGAIYERSAFNFRHAVEVTGIEGVTFHWFDLDRVSDTALTIELTFRGNFDTDAVLTFTVGADAIVGYDGPALIAQVPVTGGKESVVATTEEPLTEATLDESVVTLTLSGRTYERSNFRIKDAVSVSGIDGVTVGTFGVDRVSDTEIAVELEFNGDFDADTTLTFTVEADALLGYGGPALIAELPVTGGQESVAATTELPLTEAMLDESVVTLTLSGRTFERSSFKVRNGVTVSGIDGVAVGTFGIDRVSDTKITVELAYAGNIDIDSTLTFTVEAGAIVGYGGPALIAELPVTGGKESVVATTTAPLTEATLDESVVTLTLSGAIYEQSSFKLRGNVQASGINGVTIGTFGVDRVNDTQVTVELEFDGTDFDTDATLTFTVEAGAMAGYDGSALTTQIPITASTESVVATTESPLTEATLHEGIVTLTLSGGTYERSSFKIKSAVSVSGIDGVTIGTFGVDRVSDTKVTLELVYAGNIDTNSTLTFTVGAAAIVTYNGPAFTAQISVTALTESVVATTTAPLTEATLDESVVTLTLNGANYERSIWKIRGNVTVSGIAGVTMPWNQPRRKNDTELTVELAFDGTDFNTNSTLTFTVDADAIAGYNGSALTTQISVAAIREDALLVNFPNPFNPETWIPYQLSKPAEVTITIYAVDGQVVRRLALGHQAAGIYQTRSRAAYWDGRNEFGEPVASGLYFYTLTAGDFRATRKMLIRK